MKRTALILAALFLFVCAALPSSAVAATTTRTYPGSMGAVDNFLSPPPITPIVASGGLFNNGPGPLTLDLPIIIDTLTPGITTATGSVTFVDGGSDALRVTLSFVCEAVDIVLNTVTEFSFPLPAGAVVSPSDNPFDIKTLTFGIPFILPVGTSYSFIRCQLPARNGVTPPSGVYFYSVAITNP